VKQWWGRAKGDGFCGVNIIKSTLHVYKNRIKKPIKISGKRRSNKGLNFIKLHFMPA
jgi:hypothetical protein